MINAHCPACSGPLQWSEDTAHAVVGGVPASPDLLDGHATQALRAAIRALEDTAANVRWRMSRGDTPRPLDEELVRLEQDIALLTELVRPRARAVPAPRQRPAKPSRRPAATPPALLPRSDVA